MQEGRTLLFFLGLGPTRLLEKLAMKRIAILIVFLVFCANCAGASSRPKTAKSEPKKPAMVIDDEDPTIYEPELHQEYHDKRYESDEALKKYYQ